LETAVLVLDLDLELRLPAPRDLLGHPELVPYEGVVGLVGLRRRSFTLDGHRAAEQAGDGLVACEALQTEHVVRCRLRVRREPAAGRDAIELAVAVGVRVHRS